MIQGEERKYKKGQIILKEKSFELAIYDVMLGRVGVYMNYGTPEERLVVEIEAGDFLNVISFLETRPRNTTAVAWRKRWSRSSPMTISARFSRRTRPRS